MYVCVGFSVCCGVGISIESARVLRKCNSAHMWHDLYAVFNVDIACVRQMPTHALRVLEEFLALTKLAAMQKITRKSSKCEF